MQGWEKLPAPFTEYTAELRKMNPEFTFRTWDNEQLRRECAELGPSVLACYDRFPKMISKVDFGRYVLLYKYGGLSLDTDMKPLRPLREATIDQHATLVVSRAALRILYVNNALIWVMPRHPLMAHLIRSIMADLRTPDDFSTSTMYIFETTGPLMFGRWVHANRDSIQILPHIIFEPCYSKDIWCSPGEYAILDHRHQNSWKSSSTDFLEYTFFALFGHPIPAILSVGALLAVTMWPKKSVQE